MKKIIASISYIIIAVFILAVFGWVVKHNTLGDKDFGMLKKPLDKLVSFPDLLKQSVKEVKKLPETFIKTPPDFESVNKLEKDLWVLSTYSNSQKERTVELVNLRDEAVRHSWEIKNTQKPHSRILSPVMLADSSLVYSFNGETGLYCVDVNGKKLWQQPKTPSHHAITLAPDSNLWICTYSKEPKGFIIYKGHYTIDGTRFNFIDNMIARIDSKTGAILFKKSIAELLYENDLEYLLYKSANTGDPLHLNDVQPVPASSPYYQKGDVFISMRNSSCILHYRPATNELIRFLQGPFATQHDVDILNDSVIAFFNNRSHTIWTNPPSGWPISESPDNYGDFYSGITEYNLANATYRHPFDSIFREQQIFTYTEGKQEFLKDGRVLIEEQNSGVVWVLRGDSVLYKNVFSSHHEGYHHLTNWITTITK